MAEGLLVEINSSREPVAALRSRMTGALSVEVVESRVPQEQRTWLMNHGFLQFIHRPNGTRFYLPKVPELLVAATSQIVAEETAGVYDAGGAEAAADHVILRTAELPYNGVSCALALMFMDENRHGAASEIIPFLLAAPPQTFPIRPGAKLAVLNDDGSSTDLDFTNLSVEQIGDAKMLGNMHPWLAAAYLGVFVAEGDQRIDVIRTIGSSPIPVTGMEQSPKTLHGFQETEVPGGIRLLHGAAALLEPITPVIYSALKEQPREITALKQEAVANKNIPLMHRLLHGAFGVSGIANPKINDFVMSFANELRAELGALAAEVMNNRS